MGNFKSENINTELEKNGFAIASFASENQIAELFNYYQQLPPINLPGTHVTMFNPSYDYRKNVDKKIKEVCAQIAEDMMNGYCVLYTNFMVKETGAEGDFPVHQDWTYVDETEYSSYAFWIPLQTVNAQNGALHIVKKSHRFNTGLRGPYVHEPFQHLSNTIREKYAEPIVLKAGEVLIWDHRLIHFSLPNLSGASRIAFTLIMIPKNTEVFHCIAKQDVDFDLVEQFAVDSEFYLNYQIGKRPEGISPKKVTRQARVIYSENYIASILD